MPIHPLRFLDCNCGVGPWLGGADAGIPGLLATMDDLGIAEACVFALSAAEGEPGPAHAWLTAAVANHPRLRPVWVVDPHQCGEFPAPGELHEQLKRAGVRTVRLPLSKTSYLKDLDLCLLEPLFDLLGAHRVPLFLDCQDSGEQVSTAQMKELLETWPELPVILSFPKLEQFDRRLYYLWERSNRLYVELAGYQTLGAIEEVTTRFGSNRIVFGTRSPSFDPLQTMLQVVYAGVDESVRRDIAGDTVRGLLQEVRL